MASLFLSPPPPPPPTNTRSLSYIENLFLHSPASVRALNSCAAQRDLRLAAALHAATVKSGLDANPFVGNSLLHAYASCGRLDCAVNLFDRMPERDVVSWTSLITGHSCNGAVDTSMHLFLDMLLDDAAPPPNEFTLAAILQACALRRDEAMARMVHGYLITTGFLGDTFVCNSLIDVYSKSGLVMDAEKLVRRLECRDVVSWTAVVSACVLHGMLDEALVLFVEMLKDGIAPNAVTMLSVIQACSLLSDPRLLDWIHAWVVKLELILDVLVANSLVEMYSKNGLVEKGMKVLFEFCLLNGDNCFEYFDPDAMAALAQGCSRLGLLEWGKSIHGFLIKLGFYSCAIAQNSLMGMYAKHAQVDSAHTIFERMERRDVVSWNTMISCFANNGHPLEALRLLTEIHCGSGGELPVPDSITVLSAIQACSEIASIQQGQVLHGYVIRSGFDRDVFICNALVDMYSKSGRIDLAEQIFEETDVKDLGSWNSMIAAYGIHGDGNSALRVFTELTKLGRDQPNGITFISVISACGHSGLTTEGYECFKSMRRDYNIEPSMVHYASTVDLLARCGKLEEAWDFIKGMPITPGVDVWGSLLGACGIHSDAEIAERAAEELSVLEPDGVVWRVALANVYASAGRWEDAAEMRAQMKRKGSRKEAGWSSVEVNGRESFKFMAGDTRHPETSRIYEVWDGIRGHIVDAPAER